MTHKHIHSKVLHDEDEEEAKKMRRLKVAHGGKTAKLGRKRKHRDDGGTVENTVKSQPDQSRLEAQYQAQIAPPYAPKTPSWQRIPNGPEPLPPAPGLTDEEFKARWGMNRKRGGSIKR